MNEDQRKSLFQSLAEDGWAMTDQAVPMDLWKALSSWIDQRARTASLRPAGIGRANEKQLRTDIRGDLIEWLDQDHREPPVSWALPWLESLRHNLNQEFFLGLRSCEAHVAQYPEGRGYDLHVDQSPGQTHRRITFILYLNENWQSGDGGELELHMKPSSENEKPCIKTLPPIGGRLVLFRSELFPHRVLSAHRPRKSLTGWFRDDEASGQV
jgi:SM-20-related protein